MTKKGRLTISRARREWPVLDKPEHISIELTDDGFKMLFQAEITIADFARVVTGIRDVPCDYKVWDRTEV